MAASSSSSKRSSRLGFFALRGAGAGSASASSASSKRSSIDTFFARRAAGLGASSSKPQSSSAGFRLAFAGSFADFAGCAGVSSHKPSPSRSSEAAEAAGLALSGSGSRSSASRAGRRRVERTCTAGSASSTGFLARRAAGLGASSQSSAGASSSDQPSSSSEPRPKHTLLLLGVGELLLVLGVHLGELLAHVVQREQVAEQLRFRNTHRTHVLVVSARRFPVDHHHQRLLAGFAVIENALRLRSRSLAHASTLVREEIKALFVQLREKSLHIAVQLLRVHFRHRFGRHAARAAAATTAGSSVVIAGAAAGSARARRRNRHHGHPLVLFFVRGRREADAAALHVLVAFHDHLATTLRGIRKESFSPHADHGTSIVH